VPRPARRRHHLQRIRHRADLSPVPEDDAGDRHRGRIPNGYGWGALAAREGLEQLEYYRRLLLDLGDTKKTRDPTILAIFADAATSLRKPANLKTLTTAIDKLDWYSAREEGLGDLYEGLLEKNAAEKKSGAGQYFTPRPLIDCIVRLMRPKPGEVIQDPAAGTGGFLVAADQAIKDATDDFFDLSPEQTAFQRRNACIGAELVPDAHRLCLMNLMLHGIESPVRCLDTLSADGATLRRATSSSPTRPSAPRRAAAGPTAPTSPSPPAPPTSSSPSSSTSSARSSPAGAPPSSCRTTCCSRTTPAGAAHLADGTVRPAHHPAPAHRHLLRPGRQDQRAVLHPRPDRQANTKPSGSTTCAPTCPPSARPGP
jgi:hypothetical protein